MKHRSACVSPQGGLELCKLLCYKEISAFIETIEKLLALEISERLRVGSIKPILSEKKLRKKEGKGHERKHTNLLVVDCAISKGRKWLISWLKRTGIFKFIFLAFEPEGKAVIAKRLVVDGCKIKCYNG